MSDDELIEGLKAELEAIDYVCGVIIGIVGIAVIVLLALAVFVIVDYATGTTVVRDVAVVEKHHEPRRIMTQTDLMLIDGKAVPHTSTHIIPESWVLTVARDGDVRDKAVPEHVYLDVKPGDVIRLPFVIGGLSGSEE